tara:strand:+ start:222 stop:620 length:399 start_codon:yes stop_codon:yes gene_type:complete
MAITSVKFGTSAAGANNSTYSPDQNPNIGTDLSKSYDGIIVKKALGGKTYTFSNHQSSRKSRKLVYENISETNKNKLLALFDLVKGQKTSFFYSEDGFTSNGFEVRFIGNKLSVSETAYNVYRVGINIEEQL